MTQHKPKWRNHLYALRRSRGLQQKHLAHLLGYRDTSAVSRLESGTVLPSPKVALLIEIVLGARLQEIYIDLTRELRLLLAGRCRRLPTPLARHLEDRFQERNVTDD
jgi:transcriptional regulator with XRE-family HTH domain